MSNIIAFPGARRPTANLDYETPSAVRPGYTGYARRNRQNPLRKLWRTAEFALVEVNKIDYQHNPRELEYIREGVEAARRLADELAIAGAKFLGTAPRRTNAAAFARKREFKAAMRQRIRDIAASRDLSDEEIKPVLTLKHYEVGRFCEQYDVRPEWLLEGKGRIFQTDAIALSPHMTVSEFAAAISEMPMADQQAIRAMVGEMLQERGQ